MKYVRLGSSGLEISAVVLGCMSFGDPGSGGHPWTLGIEASRPLVREAIESGITTFDTANVYSSGTSEEIVGRMLGEFARREDVVIATKVSGRMRQAPNGAGLSRVAIMHEIDASLRRLRTDYVDLYQIHRFDPFVPIEETMEALHDVVKAGKARYLGASSMYAWQFARMQHAADLGGWTRFVSMQDEYNLVYREEEREMHPFCLADGIGVLTWSPLARGRLTRPVGATSPRSHLDDFQQFYDRHAESDARVIDAVARVAERRAVPPAQVALSWLIHQPAVTAPIVGVTTPGQIADAVAALEIELTSDDRAELEARYVPRVPRGF